MGSDVGSVLLNFSQSFPALWQLMTATAFVLGMAFIFRAIYYMKVYGEARTMMSSQGSLKVPVTYAIIGAALLYLPNTFDILTITAFGTSNPLDLQAQQAVAGMSFVESSAQTIQALLYFVQLVGLVSFIRGWLILSHSVNQSQHNTFSKGMTHIIGGLLAINIGMFIQIMRNTFGI